MQLTESAVSELYRSIGTFSGTKEQISEVIKKNNLKLSADEFLKSLPVLKKVAANSSIEEFSDFLLKNEVPAIKLTNDEMAVMKGGALPLVAMGIAFGMMALYEGYVSYKSSK